MRTVTADLGSRGSSVVFISGAPGVGKTELICRFMTQASAPNVHGDRRTDALAAFGLAFKAVSSFHGDLRLSNILVNGADDFRLIDVDLHRWSALPKHELVWRTDNAPSEHGLVWQEGEAPPKPEFELPDRLTELERNAGVAAAPSALDAVNNPLAAQPGRLKRLYRTTLTATRAVPGPRRIAEVFRMMLRRIARAIGRLLSLVSGEPDEPAPPGRLITAQPHVTRGPTPQRAATVLSAPRRLALR